MASPIDTFKNNFFDQLKSYGDAVHDAFEQRIARPLLALKRDISRASSASRPSTEQDTDSPSFITRQESLSCSTPLEVIDIEPSDENTSLKTILDKVKSTISPVVNRRISESFFSDENSKTSRSYRHSSITSLTNKNHRKPYLRHHKSVSFADNIEYDTCQNELVDNANTLADKISMTSIDETTTKINLIDSSSNNIDDDEDDFQRHFHQAIKPRRISIGNGKDLVYQDISAEIVAYVLKHALRLIEKEDEEFLLSKKENEEYIDLK